MSENVDHTNPDNWVPTNTINGNMPGTEPTQTYKCIGKCGMGKQVELLKDSPLRSKACYGPHGAVRVVESKDCDEQIAMEAKSRTDHAERQREWEVELQAKRTLRPEGYYWIRYKGTPIIAIFSHRSCEWYVGDLDDDEGCVRLDAFEALSTSPLTPPILQASP